MDFTTDRLAQVFNENQALFAVSYEGVRPCLGYVCTWLPDSAGLLVNMDTAGTYTIWKVGINGEASAIASAVTVIANSQNGRHWLLQHDQQFYVMTVH